MQNILLAAEPDKDVACGDANREIVSVLTQQVVGSAIRQKQQPAAMQPLSEQDRYFLTQCKLGITAREALMMSQTL